MKPFWKSALWNAIRGGVIGAAGAAVLAVVALVALASAERSPVAGFMERIDILASAAFAWGALVGFCSTEPSPRSAILGVVLTAIAFVGSVALSLAAVGIIQGEEMILRDALGCAVLGPGGLAVIVCGMAHFSKASGGTSAGSGGTGAGKSA